MPQGGVLAQEVMVEEVVMMGVTQTTIDREEMVSIDRLHGKIEDTRSPSIKKWTEFIRVEISRCS